MMCSSRRRRIANSGFRFGRPAFASQGPHDIVEEVTERRVNVCRIFLSANKFEGLRMMRPCYSKYSEPAMPLNDAYLAGVVFLRGLSMEYEKPFLTFDEQADLLARRGLVFDRDVLIPHLKDVGYYRLSGYWYPFKQEDDTFIPDTKFETVWNNYTFDRQFRLIVLDAIERVEIFMRTQLAYHLASSHGAFGYREKANLPSLQGGEYHKLINRLATSYDRSKEQFVEHFRDKYGDVHDMPPYWMLVNVIDFGTMLTLYKSAPQTIKKTISAELGVPEPILESWLMTLNTVRNACAHHARLWNKRLGVRPKIPRKRKYPEWHEPYEISGDKMFGVLTILSYLLERIAPETRWRNRLFELLASRSQEEMSAMGFAAGWRMCPIWNKHVANSLFE